MAWNEQLPEWNATGVEPPASKKNEGWKPDDRPPADWFNWLFNRAYKVMQEIRIMLGGHVDAAAPHSGHETPAGATAKASAAETNAKSYTDNHAESKATHGIGSGYYIAKTSRSDQLPAYADIQGKPSSFPPSTHTHKGGDITSKVSAASAADAVPWTGVTGKPGSFAPSAHKSSHASGGADALSPADIGAETPAGAQAKVNTHANTTSAHSATSAATASRIMIRDGSGRAKVAAPSASDDIARKAEVDVVQGNLAAHLADTMQHIAYATASGTNTYTATITGIAALSEGLSVKVKVTNANTGAANLNINGLGAKSIRKSNGNTLSAGNIKAGQIVHLVYTGSVFQLLGEGGEYGTAEAAQVLAPHTIGTESGIVTGTIPSKAAATITPGTTNQAISAGQYLSGAQTILGDLDLIAENIREGVDLFGVTGNLAGIEFTVQRGSATIASNSMVQNVTISAVDMTKSIVLHNGLKTTFGNAELNFAMAQLTSNTNLEISRTKAGGSSGSSVSIQWVVIQFISGVSVQRGVFELTKSSADAPISSVDRTSSFEVFSFKTNTSNAASNELVLDAQGYLKSNEALNFSRWSSSNNTHTIAWYVISKV